MAKKTTAGAKAEPNPDIAAITKPRARKAAKRTAAETGTANDTNVGLVDYGSTIVSVPDIPARPASPSEDDIRTRAYHRWLERGAGDGMDFDDWLEAEKELRQRR